MAGGCASMREHRHRHRCNDRSWASSTRKGGTVSGMSTWRGSGGGGSILMYSNIYSSSYHVAVACASEMTVDETMWRKSK